MKKPTIENIDLPEIFAVASLLPFTGKLVVSANNLTYLDITDDYIHQLFPLLKQYKVHKPNYFGKDAVGAHITVIYPEENIAVDERDLNQVHSFFIRDLVKAKINEKIYFVLLVEAPTLLAIRRKYHLPDALCFKDHEIGFHITLGFFQ